MNEHDLQKEDYLQIANYLNGVVEGEVTVRDIDREKVARDTSLFYVKPEILVFPKNSDDIAKVLAFCTEQRKRGYDLHIAMRAAGTCMTGGPLSTSIVLDTTKFMNKVSHVTEESATTEPGVYYRDFEKETLKAGWLMPSYPASRELAAMGGIISNNSGGEKTLVYGKTEKYVQSLGVVYANGEKDLLRPYGMEELTEKMNEQSEGGRIHKEMYHLITENYDAIMAAKPSVSKNSSGYYLWNVYNKEQGIFDLSKLVIGSQGTLAAVTLATIVGIKPKTHSRMIVMFAPSTVHLGEIIVRMLTHKPETLESYDDHTFKIAMKFFKDIAKRMGGNMITLGLQFIPEFMMVLTGGVPKIILMAEFTGDSEEDVEKQVASAYEDMKSFKLPIKRTYSERQAKKYWTFRRESFSLLRQNLAGMRTAPTIDDLVVHPKDLPEFLPKLDAIFSKDIYKDLVYTVAGHMGDANFHIIPLVDIHQEGITDVLHTLMDEVFALVFEFKGSMSGEHNDGLLRTSYLPKMFSPEIISLFEKTKTIFDPQGTLNPMKKVHANKDFAWSHIDMGVKVEEKKPEPKIIQIEKIESLVTGVK
jgi:FAD/FMN-containing dehydrogenase